LLDLFSYFSFNTLIVACLALQAVRNTRGVKVSTFGRVLRGREKWRFGEETETKCNTPGVYHQLGSGFELKHDKLGGDDNVKVNLWRRNGDEAGHWK
jgi:hypothetical protein